MFFQDIFDEVPTILVKQVFVLILDLIYSNTLLCHLTWLHFGLIRSKTSRIRTKKFVLPKWLEPRRKYLEKTLPSINISNMNQTMGEV